MRKENGTGTGTGTGQDAKPQSIRRVPPPEAFRYSRSSNNDYHKDQSNNDDSNRDETSFSSGATAALATTASALSAAPKPLIRRRSSLFAQLPSRNKSRLFDDIVTSSSNAKNKNKSDEVDNIVAETMTNFSHSQPTWLQDDNQSTFLMAKESKDVDTRSKFSNEYSGPQEEQRAGAKSSLFGAVMRQFGSSISNALPPSSPFGRRRTSNTAETSPQENGSGFGGNGGSFRNLIGTPSGKTIMNIVNQFNSPFKFQSPSSSHRKRQHRRRLWNDDEDDNDDDETPINIPNKRLRLDEDDQESKQGSDVLFPDQDANDSRSSLDGSLVDEHWREAPIVQVGDRIQMEILDWSLVTKMRIEIHDGTSESMSDTWMLDAMRDNEKALTYWIHQSPIVTDESRTIPKTVVPITRTTSNLSIVQKSIGAPRSSMSRQASFGSRLDAKLANGKSKSVSRKEDGNNVWNQLAKRLVQSVRGVDAKYSRKSILKENSWWEEQTVSASTTRGEDMRERSHRQWQQALRSLFLNYRHRLLNNKNHSDSLDVMVLDTYFYCVGQDHAVLFRVSASDSNNGMAVPMVLVSSTSDSFRKRMQSNGLDLIQSSKGDESFEFLQSIQQREARERKKIIAANAAAAKKSKGFFKSTLLSPSVRADLEALRRAQAFGESAGADVMIRVKRKGDGADEDTKEKDNLPKGMSISGWDNVSLFLEVYLNLYGDTMCDDALAGNGIHLPFTKSKPSNKMLPLLICPNTPDFGPFEHASMKRLSLFPAERLPQTGSNSNEKKKAEASSRTNVHSMEIRGIVLPCVIRKTLLATRDRILKDASNSLKTRGSTNRNSSGARAKTGDSDSSRYVVLHSSRPTIVTSHNDSQTSWIGGLNGSLIFNQGKKRRIKSKGANDENDHGNHTGQNRLFECSYGNVISMAVWDASRKEVAACKQDNAFSENWIHKK